MNRTIFRPALVLAVVMGSGIAQAEEGIAETVSAEQFDGWMQEISNWGRWGDDDQLGTLNLITPEKRKAAAALVEDGVSVSLALDLNETTSELNANPFEQKLEVVEFADHVAAVDHYAVSYHGYAHSHMDGLPHFTYKGKMYNGVPADALKESGSERLGIENAHEGIFARGVLVDMAWLKEVDYLPGGTVITAEDLEAWEEKTGITLGSGDVLLLRTGRWVRAQNEGPETFLQSAAGMHASVATWLRQRDVAMIGCDGVSDVVPSNVEGKFNPLHELVLVGMGMPILDNLDLEAAAAAAKERNRWTFLLVVAPLRVPGGTGSPVNPLAVF